MDAATKERLFGLLRAFEARDRSVARRREEWARYGHILAANADELLDLLAAEEVGLSSSMGLPPDTAMAEVERLLFNTCTAAMARVDLLRKAIPKESQRFQDACAAITDPLRNADEHAIMNGLRQYVSHVGVSHMSFVGYPSVATFDGLTFYVQRDALRDCDQFKNGKSREVLDRQPVSIDVRALVATYTRLATDQDAALLAAFEAEHAAALEADRLAWQEVVVAWTEEGFGAWVAGT